MKTIYLATLALAKSSGGNPFISTLTIILFFLMFNQLMATVETLIWGERFYNWLDPIVQITFIAWSAYGVWCCAIINEKVD